MVPNHEKNGDYYKNPHLPHCQMNFTCKENGVKKSFLNKQSINVICPNEENKFMVPNQENKRDYFVNPCLSQLTNELSF